MPKFTHVHDFTPPDPPDVCELAAFPVAVVPYALAALEYRVPKYVWSEEGYVRGVQLIRSLQMAMLCGGMTDLIAEIRALRGILPAYITTPPEDRTIDMYRSLNDLIQSTIEERGVLSDGWFTGPQFATIADLVQAQRGSNSATGKAQWDEIATLISEAAGTADIANFITNLLGQTEEAVVEGGLLTFLVALTAANAAMMQQMLLDNATYADKINQILLALRGSIAPEDNVLLALRGTTNADGTRNIADLLE
jgi:hypothetical protein